MISNNDINKEIDYLSNIIKINQDKYYNNSDGYDCISDSEFDKYWDRLKELDPNNNIFKIVGKDNSTGFTKCKHIMVMGSQDKASDIYSFEKWIDNINTKYNITQFVAQHKLDGSSIELQYDKGILTKCVTRGNGVIGDDVTSNISKSIGVIKELKDKTFTGGIRGEVVLTKDSFLKYFNSGANCRNTANGIMKRKDGNGCEHLNVICYDVKDINNSSRFITELDKLDFLRKQGFTIVHVLRLDTKNDIIKYREKLAVDRENLNYDIDGIVIKTLEVDINDSEKIRPSKQIAFKFSLDEKHSVLRNVEFYISGKYRTPVAICDPVELNGTVVKRANLCNLSIIKDMNLKIGSTVVLVKRGEIIPKIESVLYTPKDGIDIIPPTICDECGSTLIQSTSYLFCPNINCPNVIIHRLIKWCKTFSIYGLGVQSITNLYNNNIIRNVIDLYDTNIDKIIAPIVGEKNSIKIKNNIFNSKNNFTITKLISGYDMDDIGSTIIDNILKSGYYNDFYSIIDIDEYSITHLQKIDGFGLITIENIIKQFKLYRKDIIQLYENVFKEYDKTFVKNNVNIKQNSFIKGKTFSITGSLQNYKSREELIDFIKNNGGFFSKSVTRNTDFLITNDLSSNSKKLKDANKHNVPILTEEMFINNTNDIDYINIV